MAYHFTVAPRVFAGLIVPVHYPYPRVPGVLHQGDAGVGIEQVRQPRTVRGVESGDVVVLERYVIIPVAFGGPLRERDLGGVGPGQFILGLPYRTGLVRLESRQVYAGVDLILDSFKEQLPRPLETGIYRQFSGVKPVLGVGGVVRDLPFPAVRHVGPEPFVQIFLHGIDIPAPLVTGRVPVPADVIYEGVHFGDQYVPPDLLDLELALYGVGLGGPSFDQLAELAALGISFQRRSRVLVFLPGLVELVGQYLYLVVEAPYLGGQGRFPRLHDAQQFESQVLLPVGAFSLVSRHLGGYHPPYRGFRFQHSYL